MNGGFWCKADVRQCSVVGVGYQATGPADPTSLLVSSLLRKRLDCYAAAQIDLHSKTPALVEEPRPRHPPPSIDISSPVAQPCAYPR
jgi:hypothetical protein